MLYLKATKTWATVADRSGANTQKQLCLTRCPSQVVRAPLKVVGRPLWFRPWARVATGPGPWAGERAVFQNIGPRCPSLSHLLRCMCFDGHSFFRCSFLPQQLHTTTSKL